VPFGERQNPAGIQGAVAVFMGKILRGEPVVIWGDGSVVRDFFHVADLSEAFVAAAASPVTAGTYNVGSGVGVSLNQLVATLREVTGAPVTVHHEEGRPFDAPAVVMDVSAIGRDLGWRPRVGFAEGLERTWAWLREEWRCGR
jgi:UDP-glucose 4-epimerase